MGIGSLPINVIVPFYGNQDITIRCVKCVLASCITVRLILVDNGSHKNNTDKLYAFLSALDSRSFEVIRLQKNYGFTAAVNAGLRRVPAGGDVLILNNDCFVSPFCIRSIGETSYQNGLAIVGPLVTDMGHESIRDAKARSESRISRAVEAIDFDDESELEFIASEHITPPAPRAYIPFCCAFIPAEVFRRVGLLSRDKGYSSGLFADNEYCDRAAAIGHKCLLDTNAIAIHLGSSTFKSGKIDYDSGLMTGKQAYLKPDYPVAAVILCDRKRYSQGIGVAAAMKLEGVKRLYVNVETVFSPAQYHVEYAELLELIKNSPIPVDLDVATCHSTWMESKPLNDQNQTYRLKRIVAARRQAVEWFMSPKNKEATHLYFVDSDTVPQVNAVTKLLSLKRACCGGTCWGRGAYAPVKLVFDEKEPITLGSGEQIAECRVFSAGSMLLSREIIERIPFRWGMSNDCVNQLLSEDPAMQSDAVLNGFGVNYVHLGVRSEHLDNPDSPLQAGDVAEF